MNHQSSLREQLDACRADSHDLDLPEFADLARQVQGDASVRASWEVSQQNDRAVRTALQEVAIPAGLEARLLAAVLAARNDIAISAPPAPATANQVEPAKSAPQGKSRAFPRRLALGWLSAAAASIIFLGLGFVVGPRFFPHAPEVVSNEDLAAQTQDWLDAAYAPTFAWQKSTSSTPLEHYPADRVVGKVARWAALAGQTESGIAYDLRLNGDQAVLLVIPTEKEYKVGSVQHSELVVSGGLVVGAWQRDGVLYVLAVKEGQDARLEAFIKRQPIG